MIGAGTVINPIIKIVTVVAILAATYLFIVKPVLDTTESTIEASFDAFGDGFGDLPAKIQDDVDAALESSDDSGRLQNCIERAVDRANTPNPQRVNRCG
ncbi:MAG: hypothetical protein ACRDLO_15590 [Solirubrobacterales bacterium]